MTQGGKKMEEIRKTSCIKRVISMLLAVLMILVSVPISSLTASAGNNPPRYGGFAPLAKVSPDKKVVLGLITTKSPELEDKERVIHRINEAAKYVPLERLYLSPQCGFASCEIGNKLTEEQQWEKLKLVKEIAEEVWGE